MGLVKVKLRDKGTSFQDQMGGQFISGNHVAEVQETSEIMQAIASGRLVKAGDDEKVTLTYDPDKVAKIQEEEDAAAALAASKKVPKAKVPAKGAGAETNPDEEEEEEDKEPTPAEKYEADKAEALAQLKAMPYNERVAAAKEFEDGKDLNQSSGNDKVNDFLMKKWEEKNPAPTA